MPRFRAGDSVRVAGEKNILTVKDTDLLGRVLVCWYETGQGWLERTVRQAELEPVGQRRKKG